MKKCLILFCLLAFTFAKAQVTHEFEVNFETASYHLADAEAAKINTILEMLSKTPESYKITIIGHTDNVGNLEYNKVLSDNRADEIAGYFRKKGFRENNITTLGKAWSEPVAANATETGKSKNRRVKVFIKADIPKVNDLGGLTLKETVFRIDTQKEQVVNYKSGSTITIPAGAFIDENGNTVKGEVDLTYIEYRNPVDFILGNIAMDFGKEHFNSAGMYKILAFKDNKPVFLRAEKTIDIDFPLESELPNLNFYNYDTIANKWTELSKLTGNEPSEAAEPEFDINMDASQITMTFSRMGTIDTVYHYIDYDACSSAYKIINDGVKLASGNESAVTGFLFEKEKRAHNIAERQEDYTANQINSIVGNSKTQRAIKQFEARIKRNQIKIDRIPKMIENAKLHLSAEMQVKYAEVQNKNKDSLSARNKKFEAQISQLKNPKTDSLAIDSLNIYPNRFYWLWKNSAEFMPKPEAAMTINEWFAYFDAHKPEMLARYKAIDIDKYCTETQRKAAAYQEKVAIANRNAANVTRKLQISQLGIFNCDQIARLENPVTVNAQYKNENGEPINPIFIYLVDSKINGILRYEGYNGYSPKHFAYSPTSKNTLLAFDANGGSYILNADDFSKTFKEKSSAILVMKKIENISNREQLAALF